MSNAANSISRLGGLFDLHPGGGCWTCQHWLGEFYAEGSAIVCRDERFNHVKSMPDGGCAFWTREPGADDEVVYFVERGARGWLIPELESVERGAAKTSPEDKMSSPKRKKMPGT